MHSISLRTNRLLYLIIVLMIHINTHAQSSDKNYVQTKVFLDENASTFLRHIDYYDELGVVSETVDVGGNASNTPIIAKTDYNALLKPFKQWAPIPSTSLEYLEDVKDVAENFYGDSRPYSKSKYDDFKELSKSWKPGEDWKRHAVKVTRKIAQGNVVKRYSVSDNGELREDGMYSYGLLTCSTTTDEDGRRITVYTNMHENTILERRSGNNDTYYVYDKYGRLSYVLPPRCQEDTANMGKYWYRYKYDDRGRCIEKQLPGCTPIKYWYDEADRIQSEQDGHLREQSLYRNYSYDGIGRLELQTISKKRGKAIESNAESVEIKNYYDDYTACCQDLSLLFPVWADSIYGRAEKNPLIARGKPTAKLCTTYNGNRYFEIYRYDAKGRIDYQLSAYSANWIKTIHTSYNFVGDVVSSEERVYTHEEWRKVLLARRRINNTYHPGTRLLASTTVTHVDKNRNTSTQTISNPTYDVFGNIVANNRPGTAADMTYEYDTLHGWLKGISSPSGFSEQLLRETATNAQFSGNIGGMEWKNTSRGEMHRYDYTYDELGRLTNSQYSSSANDTDDRYNEIVAYNSNGSITSLLRRGMKNNGTFDEIDHLSISYNGNQLMKVTDAAEAVNYNGALDFNDGADIECEYSYDSNGALKSDSNRGIASITYDYGHHPNYVRMTNRKNTVSNDYTPDGIKLSSKHTSTDASTNVRISTTDMYVDGLILRDGKPLMWQFDGGYVALNENGTPMSWNYYVTDHLGSTRKVVDSNNNVLETINYYPFGSEMRMQEPGFAIRPRAMKASSIGGWTASDSLMSASVGREIGIKDSLQYRPIDGEIGIEKPIQKENDFWQPYRFSGKELDKQNCLNMYDFGARLFDVAGVPMWTSIDPLAEKYYNVTPYSYCMGNPVMLVDPDGKEVRDGVGEYNKENAELKKLVNDLAKQNDPNSIMIVAHGVYNNTKDRFASSIDIQTYNNQGEWSHNYISNGKQLDEFLSSRSQTWQDYKNGKINADDLHIVFYSCGSAPIAQEISKYAAFKGVNIIAPNKKVHNIKYKDGSRETTVENTKFKKNKDGELERVGPYDYGSWVSCKNGTISSTYRGDKNLHPGTKGFDY